MSDGFFSKAAEKLANENGLNLSDIYTHRDDGLATLDNVKCAIFKRHREGLLVELQLAFIGINPTKTNMELLKRWYKKHVKSTKQNVSVSDIELLIVPAHVLNYDPDNPPRHFPMTLRINYRLHDTRRSQVDVANLFVVNPNSNSLIYVKNGKITSVDTGKSNGGEATRVIGKVVQSRITPLNDSNSFGKNFGVGMIGNPTPFRTRT